jgi:hypothetical protein
VGHTFLDLGLKTWLGLTVAGSVISTLSALFGILLKISFSPDPLRDGSSDKSSNRCTRSTVIR